ncbi:hypothetical protein GOODEAATRI_002109 [Goodea atripinnis]|uniref:Choline O-acetyltransferase n=1 Tax=Goodea atripinnis TaxID=208336 RepID=A0ABV0NGV6_9TELE
MLQKQAVSDGTQLEFKDMQQIALSCRAMKNGAMSTLKKQAARGQDSQVLPKVPVPPLKQTLDTYLKCVQHLVKDEQFKKTKTIVKKFGAPGGIGEVLQKKLLERRDKTANWVYDYWLEDMYLNNRLALPVNSSPAMVFPKQTFRDHKDALRRLLPVDVARGQLAGTPLCMKQYYHLFTSYRYPGLKTDTLKVDMNTASSTSEHMIVACKNQAITGMAIDNHLLGLLKVSKELKMERPDIFCDETYLASNHFILSTSQVPTTVEMFCCYGPVVPNGYGTCYNPQPHHIVFSVSSFWENTETSSAVFVKALNESLLEIGDLCNRSAAAASQPTESSQAASQPHKSGK